MSSIQKQDARRLALHGDLLDFCAGPVRGDLEPAGLRFQRGHWLLIEDGRVAGVQAEAPGISWTRADHSARLIVPGFIAARVHARSSM